MDDSYKNTHYPVSVVFEGQMCQFWLPGDRPIYQVIDAIVGAASQVEDSPFLSLPRPDEEYVLSYPDPSTGRDFPLPKDDTLILHRLPYGTPLHLQPISTPQSLAIEFDRQTRYVLFHQDAVIGVSQAGEARPDIDLRQFVNVSEVRLATVAPHHARIEFDRISGGFFIVALDDGQHKGYDTRTHVDGELLDSQQRVQLSPGIALTFANSINAVIIPFD